MSKKTSRRLKWLGVFCLAVGGLANLWTGDLVGASLFSAAVTTAVIFG